MAARWQQFMPFWIDKFFGSPAVQAMDPAARMGYLALLAVQWQSDDCSLSADEIDLEQNSRIGSELWAKHGARILRNFEMLEDGRLRNFVCFDEWKAARDKHASNTEARSEAGKRGANAKWSDGKRMANAITPDGKPMANAIDDLKKSQTRDDKKWPQEQEQGQEQKTNTPPSAGAKGEFLCATHLQQTLGIPASAGDIQVLAQVVMFEAKNRGDTEKATDWLIAQGRQAQQRGEVVNVWWFKDKKYLGGVSGTNKPSAAKQRDNENLRAIADALAKRGVSGPWDSHGANDAEVGNAGHEHVGGRDHDRPGRASPEILSPESVPRSKGAAHKP